VRELAAEGTLIVETAGEQAGQVNGLAVYDMGDYSFGSHPGSRPPFTPGKAGPEHRARNEALREDPRKAVLILTITSGVDSPGRRPSASPPRSPSNSCTG